LTLRPGILEEISFNELQSLSWQARQSSRPQVFEVVHPAGTVPVSVTGTSCSLQCSHCGGRYLEHMETIATLDSVLARRNVTGILLSGGCNSEGQVPLLSKIDCIRRKISESGQEVKINAHPGVVDKEEALAIAGFASVISFDFVLDDATIQEAFGGHRTALDYVNAFRNLRKGKAKVVPHVLVGLYKGQVRGEYEAIEFLAREGIEELIFIVFIPTPRTRWEDVPPPQVNEVLRLVAWTRLRNPGLKITLGCMRPKGRYREALDPACVMAGVDGIVLPHPLAVREAQSRGLRIIRKEECCAFD
jgi:uncharacterized radical SAM superfamily protein